MIKYSYLQDQILKLKKEFGKKNIILLKNHVLIKNIKIPLEFGSETGVLSLEIPDGYGYGIDVMMIHILVGKNKSMHHFTELNWTFMPVEIQNEFNIIEKKMSSWYWMCFHIKSNYRIKEENSNELVPLREYPFLLYIVLDAIAKEDPKMLEMLKMMNLNRDEYYKEYKKLMSEISLENNWKKMSWMYD